MIGEDGAANYSFLLESYENGRWTTTFPIKWLEGLGQPNPFVTFTFDPFSWVLLLPMAAADAFRVSMALRATTCWLGTYLVAAALFRSRRDLPIVAAFLNMLLNFTLGHTWAIPTVAGIPNATHYAVFPLLLAAIVATSRRARWLTPVDAALALLLAFFLITFPLSAVIGYGVALAFSLCIIVFARRADRPGAIRAAAKVVAVGGAVLLAPRVGVWHAWSAVANVSARVVFADELYTYQRAWEPPYMWTHTPLAVRLCLVWALAILLYRRPWPRPLRIVVGTLVLVAGGVQAVSLVERIEVVGGWLARLPRVRYFEFYLPVFYAITGAFALCDWPRLLPIGVHGRALARWATGCAVFVAAATSVFFGVASVKLAARWGLLTTGAIVVVEWTRRALRRRVAASPAAPRSAARRVVTAAVVLGLVVGSVWTWTVSPGQFHPLFARRCEHMALWCRDPVGPTVGAADTPITQFLRSRLSAGSGFAGRAETLLVPSPRFRLGDIPRASWSPELFEQAKSWYTRAYEARAVDLDRREYQLRTKPSQWVWAHREKLWGRLQAMSVQGDIENGALPEDVVAEILAWLRQHPTLMPPAIIDRSARLSEVQLMVEERNRGFARTGNGMMLRALPLQHVPVASSYEQALDFLYYLVWTRYLNEDGEHYTRSINLTALEVVHPERLALLGVRYVIARESAFERPPPLEKVFSWRGYAVYEVVSPNTAGFSPTTAWFGATLNDELRLMRRPAFDPRTVVVASARDRDALGGHPLQPMRRSRIVVAGNELLFEGDAAGVALAVLPFKYSHCWTPTWATPPGRVLRVDAGLIGVLFRERASLRLRWSAGYGSVDCLYEDRRLVPQAKDAAAT